MRHTNHWKRRGNKTDFLALCWTHSISKKLVSRLVSPPGGGCCQPSLCRLDLTGCKKPHLIPILSACVACYGGTEQGTVSRLYRLGSLSQQNILSHLSSREAVIQKFCWWWEKIQIYLVHSKTTLNYTPLSPFVTPARPGSGRLIVCCPSTIAQIGSAQTVYQNLKNVGDLSIGIVHLLNMIWYFTEIALENNPIKLICTILIHKILIWDKNGL